jgi:hypothetical protein
MAFTIKYGNGFEFEVDYFSKVLMFQNIIDMDTDNNTKNLLLFILRKTLCFDKLDDRLSMYLLSKQLKVSDKTLRNTVKTAQNDNLIKVVKSIGGHTKNSNRFNLFRLSDMLLMNLIEYIEEIRENNDFKD